MSFRQLLLRTFNVHVTREKLPKRRLYKKFVSLMLMKLTLACKYERVRVIFTWPKLYFNVCAFIFYVCEGLSHAIKHAKKIMVSIFFQ